MKQNLSWDGLKSDSFHLPCGVPQGSALSPTLFNIYVMPLASLVRKYGFIFVSYADDSQLVISMADKPETTAASFYTCLTEIMNWMSLNFLKINTEKTEVIEFGNGKSSWNNSWWPSEAGECPRPVSKVRNLGVMFDDNLNFSAQVNSLTSDSFFLLKTLRKIFPFIPPKLQKAVEVALFLSKLDYCNALFLGIDKFQIQKLQSLQNAAARLLLK